MSHPDYVQEMIAQAYADIAREEEERRVEQDRITGRLELAAGLLPILAVMVVVVVVLWAFA